MKAFLFVLVFVHLSSGEVSENISWLHAPFGAPREFQTNIDGEGYIWTGLNPDGLHRHPSRGGIGYRDAQDQGKIVFVDGKMPIEFEGVISSFQTKVAIRDAKLDVSKIIKHRVCLGGGLPRSDIGMVSMPWCVVVDKPKQKVLGEKGPFTTSFDHEEGLYFRFRVEFTDEEKKLIFAEGKTEANLQMEFFLELDRIEGNDSLKEALAEKRKRGQWDGVPFVSFSIKYVSAEAFAKDVQLQADYRFWQIYGAEKRRDRSTMIKHLQSFLKFEPLNEGMHVELARQLAFEGRNQESIKALEALKKILGNRKKNTQKLRCIHETLSRQLGVCQAHGVQTPKQMLDKLDLLIKNMKAKRPGEKTPEVSLAH